MAWPTAAEMRAAYDALAYFTDDTLIDPFIADAVGKVTGKLARRYDVSGWAASTPPQAFTWVKQLAYALFKIKSHSGSKEQGGDSVALALYRLVMDELKDAVEGEPPTPILDEDGNPLPINIAPSTPASTAQTILLRTTLPIHTMGAPERSRVYLPNADTRRNTSRWR